MHYFFKISYAFLLLSSLSFASSGMFIGYGVKSNAMAGVGTALFMGTESALKNPAMLTYARDDELSFSVSNLKDNTQIRADANVSAFFVKTLDDISSFGYLKRFNENLVLAIHSADVIKKSLDYTGQSTATFINYRLDQRVTDTAYALAYQVDNLSLAFSTVVTTASLKTFDDYFFQQDYEDSLSFSFQVGLAYKISNFQMGVSFKDERNIYNRSYWGTTEYLNVMPAELSLGLAYQGESWSVAFDFKRVFWSSAFALGLDFNNTYSVPVGFGPEGLLNQNTYALGISYDFSKLSLRVGIDISDKNYNIDTLAQNGKIFEFLVFNDMHITAGLAYDVFDFLSIEAALVLSPPTEFFVLNSSFFPSALPVNNIYYSSDSSLATVGLKFTF